MPVNRKRGRYFRRNVILLAVGLAFLCTLTAVMMSFGQGVRVVWDTKGLEHELATRVYGQERAVQDIQKIITRPIPYNKNMPIQSRHQIVFILGGPGVGKSHVINILTKHVKYESFTDKSKNISIEIDFEKPASEASPFPKKCSRSRHTNIPNISSITKRWTSIKKIRHKSKRCFIFFI